MTELLLVSRQQLAPPGEGADVAIRGVVEQFICPVRQEHVKNGMLQGSLLVRYNLLAPVYSFV